MMNSEKLDFALQNCSPSERRTIELSLLNLNSVLDLVIEKAQPQAFKDNHSEQLISDNVVYDPAKDGPNRTIDLCCEKLMVDNHSNDSIDSGYGEILTGKNKDNLLPDITKDSYGEIMVDNCVVDSYGLSEYENSGYCKNLADNNSVKQVPASPHGLHNYLYNIYDRWTDLCADEEQSIIDASIFENCLNDRTKDSHCEEAMVDNNWNYSGYGYGEILPGKNKGNLSYGEKQMVENYAVDDYHSSESGNPRYCKNVVDNYSVNQWMDLNTVFTKDSYCEKLMVDHSGDDWKKPVNNDDIGLLHPTKNTYDENLMVDTYIADNSPADSDNFGHCVKVVDNNSLNKGDEVSAVDDITYSSEKTADPTHIKLTQIQESNNYFDENGFVYSINNNKRKLKSLYFRCKNSSGIYQCPARAVAKNGNLEQAKLTKAHRDHLPEKQVLAKVKFDKLLDKICKENEFMSRRDIYFKARDKVHPDDVPFIPLRDDYGPFFSRRMSRVKPKNPTSFEEFEDLINDEQFKERYCFDKRNLTFYRGIWTDKNGNKMIVYISETGLRELMKSKVIELLMDGTFKVLPRHMKFCQLYVMSFMYEERCYPFAFFFMEKRDTAAYDLLFENLISMMTPECAEKVKTCMSDYEAAVRKILRKYFPKARITGCYFHYVKAINKQARRFGLSKHEEFEQPIREICALALLPNDFIEEGFDLIDAKIDDTAQWVRFKSYWERQWLNANISVYGLRNRTDNFSEAFNRSFNLLNGKPHQNIWVVLKNLKDMERDTSDRLLKAVKGKIFTRPPNKIMEKLNKKINEATDRFDENEDVARFLQHITYDEQIQRACKQCHLFEVDDKNDEYDENDEIEEFIPNDFDENANFKRKQTPELNRKRKAENQNNEKQSNVEGVKKPRLGRQKKVGKNTDKRKQVALFIVNSSKNSQIKPRSIGKASASEKKVGGKKRK